LRRDRNDISEDERGNVVVMVPYRIEVGRKHGVTPKDIVGAIANEGNLPSRLIGRIDLFDDYSTVDLPDDLDRDTLNVLRSAWVRRRQLNISRADGHGGEARPPRKAHAPGKPGGKPGGWKKDRPAGAGGKPFKSRRDHEAQ
jgi:ATP-dependent RNA helicase DeaD